MNKLLTIIVVILISQACQTKQIISNSVKRNLEKIFYFQCHAKTLQTRECLQTEKVLYMNKGLITKFKCRELLLHNISDDYKIEKFNKSSDQSVAFLFPGGILGPGRLCDPTDVTRIDLLQQLKLEIESFYVENTIQFDINSDVPNIEIFSDGKIIVYGGFARFSDFNQDGIALGIAVAVAEFSRDSIPRHSEESLQWAACSRAADWYSVSVMRVVYGDDSIYKSMNGAEQLKKYMLSVYNPSYVQRPCFQNLSQCRYETYLAATQCEDFPECSF